VRVFCDDALQQEAFLGFAGHDAVAGRFARLGEVRAGVLLGIEAERALKEIFSPARVGTADGAAGLAGAAACAGSFFSEELASACSGAFLQETRDPASATASRKETECFMWWMEF